MVAVTFSSAEKMDLENRVFWSQKGRFWSIFEAVSKCVECLQVQFFALRLLYYSCRLQWRRPEVFICLQQNLRTLRVYTEKLRQFFVEKDGILSRSVLLLAGLCLPGFDITLVCCYDFVY